MKDVEEVVQTNFYLSMLLTMRWLKDVQLFGSDLLACGRQAHFSQILVGWVEQPLRGSCEVLMREEGVLDSAVGPEEQCACEPARLAASGLIKF